VLYEKENINPAGVMSAVAIWEKGRQRERVPL